MHNLKHARFICPTLIAAVLAAGLLATPDRALSQSGSNPTAQAVTEQRLLDERSRIEGRITIPDDKAAILQQPQGRTYQSFHEGALPWIGAVAVIGMLVLLAVSRIRTRATYR